MPRKVPLGTGPFALVVGLVLFPSCQSAEEELVDRFLQASQRGDNETVAALSMVAFPDEVLAWKLLTVGEQLREPYRVPQLRQRVEDAEDRRDEQFKAFGEFRQQNYDDLARIQRRLRDDPQHQFTGHLLDLKRQWDAFREERRAVVAGLHEAERDLEWEIRRVNKSLMRESSPEYLTGETLRKEVRVRVTTPSGERDYRITLTRYDLRNQFDAVVPTRWIVTEVEPDGPGAP
jgi:hypothetical protein